MNLKEEHVEYLLRIRKYEEENKDRVDKYGWTWRDVQTPSFVIHTLLTNGLVVCVFQSNNSKTYRLTDIGKQMEVVEEVPVVGPIDTSSLFQEIVGYDNVKDLFRNTMSADKPVHILLYGPPSIAKSLFLWSIERQCGAAAMWLIGSATSKSGLQDAIQTGRPKFLLVDELEKMSPVDMAGLLSIMEGGRLIRAKVGRELREKVSIWVFATANRINNLPPELLSRFAKVPLKQYTIPEFCEVVKNVLTVHEGLDSDTAGQIATILANRTNDVRDAVRVARLSKTAGVDEAIRLLNL